MGVRGRGLGPPGEARVARRRVQPGKTRGRRPRRPRRAAPPPSRSSRTAPRRSPSARHGRRRRSPPRPRRVALHRNADRRLASSASPSRPGRRHPGPFQRSQRAAASLPKCAACRSRSGLASPACATAGPRRTPGSSRRGCTGSASACGRRRAATCGPASREVAAPRRRRRPGDGAEPGGRSRPRRPTPCGARALGVVQQVVGPRDRVPEGQLTIRPVLRARSAAGTGRRGGPAPRPRSWRPCAPRPARSPAGARRGSRRSRSPPPPFGSSKMPKPGRTARARSTNKVTASEVTPPSSASGETGTRLTGDPQALPRRRQDPGRLGAGEDLPDRRRGRRQEVLAVVDHDEQTPPGHRLRDGVDDGASRPGA